MLSHKCSASVRALRSLRFISLLLCGMTSVRAVRPHPPGRTEIGTAYTNTIDDFHPAAVWSTTGEAKVWDYRFWNVDKWRDCQIWDADTVSRAGCYAFGHLFRSANKEPPSDSAINRTAIALDDVLTKALVEGNTTITNIRDRENMRHCWDWTVLDDLPPQYNKGRPTICVQWDHPFNGSMSRDRMLALHAVALRCWKKGFSFKARVWIGGNPHSFCIFSQHGGCNDDVPCPGPLRWDAD